MNDTERRHYWLTEAELQDIKNRAFEAGFEAAKAQALKATERFPLQDSNLVRAMIEGVHA